MSLTPVLLTDAELDALCTYLSETSYIYYPIATDFFKDLYKTGCRPMELLTINLWEYISTGLIILTPLKGNDPRYFTEDDLSPGLVYAIQNQIRPYQALSLRQLTSVLKKILPVIEVTTIEKSAIDYMFRYNAIKVLHNAGQTDTEIKDKFGWSTDLLSASYYNKPVYAIGEVPPTIYNLLIDNSAHYLVDADGTIITYPTIENRLTDNANNILIDADGTFITFPTP